MSHTKVPAQEPAAVPLPGWTPIEMPVKTPNGPAFLRGTPNEGRIRVAYFKREADQRLVGRVWFGPGTEGPPGHAHGGSISAVLDEAMGAAAWHDGHPVVAANLSVDFRAMVPLGTDATFETWITQVDGRKVRTRSTLVGPDGTVFAEGTGLYIRLSEEKLAEHFGDFMRR